MYDIKLIGYPEIITKRGKEKWPLPDLSLRYPRKKNISSDIYSIFEEFVEEGLPYREPKTLSKGEIRYLVVCEDESWFKMLKNLLEG